MPFAAPAAATTSTGTPAVRATSARDDDPTPQYVVDTRNAIGTKRRTERDTLSAKERRRHVTTQRNLTRPYNPVYMQEVRAVRDQPTPERALTMLQLAEDEEESD
jgi:hypothetical protein